MRLTDNVVGETTGALWGFAGVDRAVMFVLLLRLLLLFLLHLHLGDGLGAGAGSRINHLRTEGASEGGTTRALSRLRVTSVYSQLTNTDTSLIQEPY